MKNHWLWLLLMAAITLNFFFLQPVEERYYPDFSRRLIGTLGWRITFFVAGFGALLLLIYAYRGSRDMRVTLKALVPAVLYACAFCLAFSTFFDTACLYLNRQFSRGVQRQHYLVSGLAGDSSRTWLFLVDAQTKKVVSTDTDKVVRPLILAHWRPGDSVDIPLYRGLFGIDYYRVP